MEVILVIEQIEKLAEQFETLGQKEQFEAREILRSYVEGEMDMDEVHYTLLDEGLIPMPSRCTMYNKPETSPETEEKLKDLIKVKILDR